MSRISSKNSGMELRVRSSLWSAGFRFRKHYGPYKIDIAFPSRKVAVFLDSCFWHGCRVHGSIPKTRAQFWRAKISRNRDRDAAVTRRLKRDGWLVVRIWEHDIDKDWSDVLERIKRAVSSRTKGNG